ncbi:MAG: S-methyl-5-thioribose-1-phosphate isomerase [Bacteroidota bacterium]
MKIDGQPYRSIWLHPEDERCVRIIDQRLLPHQLQIEDLRSVDEAARAIREMHVRGAPLIGATAAYGMYFACLEGQDLDQAAEQLRATRPTAVDLAWAVDRQVRILRPLTTSTERSARALAEAQLICQESIDYCAAIGRHSLPLIEALHQRKAGETVHVLTHCNAGWLACVDHGTATAPLYAAHDAGIPIHVWVDETRPRNQGARLTAWELLQHGVPHTIIADNVGGHLMQHGQVDLVIVGSDRTTRTGDVANKIGTYLKALAAYDNGVPFYVALPSSSIDWKIRDGLAEIPIEQRGAEEVKYLQGLDGERLTKVLLTPEASPAANYGFDVTPSRLVTGLITERGFCAAAEEALLSLFPEHR